MSDKTETNDKEHVFQALLELIRPTKSMLILYLLIALFILLSSRLVWFLDMVGISSTYFDFITDRWTMLDDKYDFASYWNPISNALLWFALGSIIYLLFWTLIVTVVDGYNDLIVSTRFMHPRSFHQSDYWTAIVGRSFVRIAGFCLFIVLLLWTLSSFLRHIYDQAYQSWDASNPLQIFLQMAVVIILVSFVTHGLVVGLRIGLMKRRIL